MVITATDSKHDRTAASALLFSFGTLLDHPVQQAVFGGPVPARSAILPGHDVVDVQIDDPHVIEVSGSAVHRGLRRRESTSVRGGVLELSPEELAQADAYEVDAYVRRLVRLDDGSPAWAYVAANPLKAAERIGVVGDSIAYGRADPTGGWAARLFREHVGADEARQRVFQLAAPGATLTWTAQHAPVELARRRVDTALISAGINDLVGIEGTRSTPAELVEIAATLCKRLEEQGARPVFLGPIWTDEERAAQELGLQVETGALAAYRDMLLTWGERTNHDVIDLWPALENRPDLMADGIHPTTDGHAKIWAMLSGGGMGGS